MERSAIGALVVAAVVALTGCKGRETAKAAAAEQAAADTGEIVHEEDDVLARRDALVQARQRIRGERAELAERRKQARAAGADTADIDAADDKLLAEEKGLVDEEVDLNRKYDAIIQQRREMIQVLSGAGGEGARLAAREATVGAREKDFGRRERDLADREAKLAEREREQAKREKETCGSATPTTIIQTVDVKGSKYTRNDVEPLLKRARGDMSKKGILASDLPAPVQGLEKEATSAMAEGDFGRARFAAAQLVASIDAVHVDKAFIAAKIGRLNGAIKGKALSADQQKEVESLFRDATADYGDGRFGNANRKLNRIYGML